MKYGICSFANIVCTLPSDLVVTIVNCLGLANRFSNAPYHLLYSDEIDEIDQNVDIAFYPHRYGQIENRMYSLYPLLKLNFLIILGLNEHSCEFYYDPKTDKILTYEEHIDKVVKIIDCNEKDALRYFYMRSIQNDMMKTLKQNKFIDIIFI